MKLVWDISFGGCLFERRFIHFRSDNVSVLFVPFELLLEFSVIVLTFLLFTFFTFSLFLTSIAQNFYGSLSGLLLAIASELILVCFSIGNFAFQVGILFLFSLRNVSFLFFLFILELLLPFIALCLIHRLVFQHSIMKLALVEFFGHLPVECELLLERVSECNFRR